MNKLKKLFKKDKDSSDSHAHSASAASASPTQAAPSTTTSAPAPKTSNAVIPEKPTGVLLTTNYGDITIGLYSDKAPKVCALLHVLCL
jgi:peptidyl-prolyl cis-trans isomerase-like 1